METFDLDAIGCGANQTYPRLIPMVELQRMLGCGKTTAFSIVGRREIETVRIGRRRMALLQSAIDYVQRLRGLDGKTGTI